MNIDTSKRTFETTCIICGKALIRQNKNLIINRGYAVCARPAYCQYARQLSIRDPKAYKILDHAHTDNFAYLVGLIATDGHIFHPSAGVAKNMSYGCNVTLHADDRYLLESIQSEYGGKLLDVKDNTCRWYISSKTFLDFLIQSVGLTTNKTYTLDIQSYYETLSVSQQFALLRGVIDGDGMIKLRTTTVTARSKSKMYVYDDRISTHFNICSGSEKFITFIQKIIHDITSESITVSKSTSGSYFYIQKSAIKVIEFLRLLYNVSGDDFVLVRKLEELKKIEEIILMRNKTK